jgi:hypothetical protein
MKLIQLLLISTALALTSQFAQATVVNLYDDPLPIASADILCRNIGNGGPYVQNCWLASEQGATGPANDGILDAYEGKPESNPNDAVPGFDRINLLYKAEEGNPTDVGNLDSAYETTFTYVDNKATGAIIEHIPGQASVDCSASCFLLVKDGVTPFAYLFMLSLGWDATAEWATVNNGPSWDGIEDLVLKNFWIGTASISYAALYSPAISQVPVPAAFWLFGTALMCFIGLSRSTRV